MIQNTVYTQVVAFTATSLKKLFILSGQIVRIKSIPAEKHDKKEFSNGFNEKKLLVHNGISVIVYIWFLLFFSAGMFSPNRGGA